MNDCWNKAVELIDIANRQDPNLEATPEGDVPKEWLYGQRMSGWLKRLAPEASPALQLAVRAQHLERWKIPRSSYPEGKAGYHRWRKELGRFHAARAAELLKEAGVDPSLTKRVEEIIRKEGLGQDPETQLLEDTACLVFLEHHFGAFAAHHTEEKLVAILRKTWKKMSPAAHEAALTLVLPQDAARLVKKALEPAE
ncbi:MAG: DUF4202 domain-containing protein [Deltaproteobacteria bacterium]|nr:DUF4202 domain-containing protein [Deltaproteobacteria bacterium]